MEKNKNAITLSVVLVIMVGIVFYLDSGDNSKSPASSSSSDVKLNVNSQTKEEKAKKYEVAKEISTPDGFINTDGKSIAIEENIGKKVILVDFWTYSCINCQRTLPYLNEWQEKYGDKGLLILGVHTPEFDFEKDYENVKKAVEKFGIKYPVVLDNDFSTWQAYKNRYWPRKYLIDIDGFVVYDHIGEGGYEETEKKIVELLNEKNKRMGESEISLDMSSPKDTPSIDFKKVKSPETYLGGKRMEYIASLPASSCVNKDCDFTYSGKIKLNAFEFSGRWNAGQEETVLKSSDGSLYQRFSANKLNLVAGTIDGKEVKAEIYLDGKKADVSNEGSDVKDGAVTFKDHRLYNLIDLKGNYGEHTLEIRFLDSGVSVFAFTFG